MLRRDRRVRVPLVGVLCSWSPPPRVVSLRMGLWHAPVYSVLPFCSRSLGAMACLKCRSFSVLLVMALSAWGAVISKDQRPSKIAKAPPCAIAAPHLRPPRSWARLQRRLWAKRASSGLQFHLRTGPLVVEPCNFDRVCGSGSIRGVVDR